MYQNDGVVGGLNFSLSILIENRTDTFFFKFLFFLIKIKKYTNVVDFFMLITNLKSVSKSDNSRYIQF